jgi:hypothetical protein
MPRSQSLLAVALASSLGTTLFLARCGVPGAHADTAEQILTAPCDRQDASSRWWAEFDVPGLDPAKPPVMSALLCGPPALGYPSADIQDGRGGWAPAKIDCVSVIFSIAGSRAFVACDVPKMAGQTSQAHAILSVRP